MQELSGFSLGRYNKAPKLELHKRENISLAINFLTIHEKVLLVNIGADGELSKRPRLLKLCRQI